MEKSLLRKEMTTIRSGYQELWLKENSKIICQHLEQWSVLKDANCVMGYLAYEHEVNVDDVLTFVLNQKKKVAVPFIEPNSKDNIIKAIEFDGFEEVVLGEYGIRTVDKMGSLLDVESIDLILVPGVAFTVKGDRLGMGKGYYDRFLAKAKNAKKVGVTLSMQLAKSVPTEGHDVKVDYLVTEKGIIDCNKD